MQHLGSEDLLKKEIRATGCLKCELRAAETNQDGGITFSGYAAVFHSWSEDLGGFREQIAPGAFAEAITSDDVRALWNHDANYVLGRNRSGTLSLKEDEHGLRFTCKAPDTTWARDLRESVKRGDVDSCSFGFETLRDSWRTADGKDERTLEKVRLLDVSIVTYPAYPATAANVRSAAMVYTEHRALCSGTDTALTILRHKMNLKEKELILHE